MEQKKVCGQCGGRKVIRVEPTNKIPGLIIPGGAVAPCPCTYVQRTIRNTEKGWKFLSASPILKGKSPLMEFTESNLWVTASIKQFRPHLKHVAIRKGPSWDFKVVSDKALIKADFANMSVRGVEIMDPDFETLGKMASKSLEYLTLSDLIEPPELLIIQLGVKGRNKYLPEVLYETLSQREHLGKKTWIWDQPHRPFSLNHHGFSEDLASFMDNDWEYGRVQLSPSGGNSQMMGAFGMDSDGEEEYEEFLPPQKASKAPEPPIKRAKALKKSEPKEVSIVPEEEDEEEEEEAPNYYGGLLSASGMGSAKPVPNERKPKEKSKYTPRKYPKKGSDS